MSQKFFLRLVLCQGFIVRKFRFRMFKKNFLRVFKEYKSDLPSLTIVGVGPGDPSLLTIAAVDAILSLIHISEPTRPY